MHRTSRGCVVWLTGLSGAGKSTLAHLVAMRLLEMERQVSVLDGDEVRKQFWPDLGYTRVERDENVHRIAAMAAAICHTGSIAIVAVISPFKDGRNDAKAMADHFLEIFVSCPMSVLLSRDPKGLYHKALSGELPNFTGISDPYEPPINPDLVIDTSIESPTNCANRILALLFHNGHLSARQPTDRFLRKVQAGII